MNDDIIEEMHDLEDDVIMVQSILGKRKRDSDDDEVKGI